MATKKKFKPIFLVISFVWSLVLTGSIARLLIATPALAEISSSIKYQSQIPFITLDPKNPESVAEWQAAMRRDSSYYNQETGLLDSDLLARYIKVIYDYGIFMATILGGLVLMAGGLIWLSSGGNESKITQAKTLILSSLTGIIIVFGSWVLLNTINPDLLKMKVIPAKSLVAKNLNSALLTCEWRCQGVADKCEGGGGNDNIAASSPWYTATLETCQQKVGNMPTAKCRAGEIYNCCCKKTIVATDIPDQAGLIACENQDKTPKNTGSPCKLGNTPGYCKSVLNPLINKWVSTCQPCLKNGEKCNHNIDDYECLDKNGVCGSGSGGNCDSQAKTDNVFLRGASWISSGTIECNAINSDPTGLLEVLIECRCK